MLPVGIAPLDPRPNPRSVPIPTGMFPAEPVLTKKEYGAAIAFVMGTARCTPQLAYWGPPILWPGGRATGRVLFIADPNTGLPHDYEGTVNAAVYILCEAPITAVKKLYHQHFGFGIAPASFQGLLYANKPGSSLETIIAATGVSAWSGYSGTAAEGMGHQGSAQLRMTHCFSAEGGAPRYFDAEVEGYGAGAGGESASGDAHPADLLLYLLTDTKNGLGLSSSLVNVDTGIDGTAAASFRRYCSARGWYVSRGVTERVAVTDLIDSLLKACDSTLVLIDGKMTAIPYGDQVLSRAGFTYTPYTTPVVIDEDELVHEPGEPPIRVERRQEKDIFGVQPISYLDRSQDYKPISVEWIDPVWTSQYGARRAEQVDFEWVMAPAHAAWVTQMLAQRAIYQRNRYTFRIGPRWCLLTPMDFLALTESKLGIADLRVRVTAIDEQEDGSLEVEAVEWPTATGEPIDLTPQSVDGLKSAYVRRPAPWDSGYAAGGGNLLKNARLYDAAGSYSPWAVYNNSQGSEPSTITGYASGGPDGGSYQRHAWTGTNTTTKGFYYGGSPTVAQMVRTDVDYVLSWYGRAGAAQSFGMEPRWNNDPDEQVALLNPNLSTAWQRYAYRIRWNGGSTVDPSAYISILNGAAMTGYVEIACAQLEEGSQPTGWQRSADETRAAADQAQTTADGKNTVFRQASAPTPLKLLDLWVDTDDANRLYVCTSLSSPYWTDARDAGIWGIAQLTATNLDNLIPNANSELENPPAGSPEAAAVSTDSPYAGSKCRKCTGVTIVPITDYIACTPGDKFYLEAYAKVSAGTGNIVIRGYAANKNQVSADGAAVTATSYGIRTVSFTAPSTVVWLRVELNGPSGSDSMWADAFYLRRVINEQVQGSESVAMESVYWNGSPTTNLRKVGGLVSGFFWGTASGATDWIVAKLPVGARPTATFSIMGIYADSSGYLHPAIFQVSSGGNITLAYTFDAATDKFAVTSGQPNTACVAYVTLSHPYL